MQKKHIGNLTGLSIVEKKEKSPNILQQKDLFQASFVWYLFLVALNSSSLSNVTILDELT